MWRLMVMVVWLQTCGNTLAKSCWNSGVLLIYHWFNYWVQLGLWSTKQLLVELILWVVLVNLWLLHWKINIWETQLLSYFSLVPVLGGHWVTGYDILSYIKSKFKLPSLNRNMKDVVQRAGSILEKWCRTKQADCVE